MRQKHHQIEVGQARPQPKRLTDRHRDQHMGRVDQPRAQHVAALRPGPQPDQIQLQPFFGSKTQLARDNQRRRVNQGKIA